jgi:hypothetical protein
MRLKFIFFPIVVIVSVWMFVFFTWPAIGEASKINKEKKSRLQLLEAVQKKQAEIKKTGIQIDDDVKGTAMIYDYLPEKKMEEKIIGEINYLANDAGVFISNISLRSVASSNVKTMTNNTFDANRKAISSTIEEVDLDGFLILVAGNYSSIRLFVDELQKINLFNNIKSLTISNRNKEKDLKVSAEESAGSTQADMLEAEIAIDFGNLKRGELDENGELSDDKVEKLDPILDNEFLPVLKKYISQKTITAEAFMNSNTIKGRTNPFLP